MDSDEGSSGPRPRSVDAIGDHPPASETVRRMVADLVLETTADGIWLIDAEARTTFVNRRLADLLGYSEQEMLGVSIFSFIERARWPAAQRNLRRRALGIEDRQEVKLLRRDGSTVWVLGSASPLFDGNGDYVGSLALLADLSAQKEREHKLQTERDDLRNRGSVQSGVLSVSGALAPYREPFRTAIVVATYGTLLASIAVLTTGAVVGAFLGRKSAAPEI
jgi:PAS domain S-box-containing protein